MKSQSPSVALVISNEYHQFKSIELNGCYRDAYNFISTLQNINSNIKIIHMRDDLPINSDLFPSTKNIITQLQKFCSSREIVSYFYYSGHGSSLPDTNKDEQTNLIDIIVNNKIDKVGNNKIERNSNDLLTNGQFRDSCIVTNEINNIGFLSDDVINYYFKTIAPNKRIYCFFDSCNSGTIIDLYAIYFSDPKNIKKFSSKNISNLLNEMKKPENKTDIMKSLYKNKITDIKGNIILLSGTRDNTFSYEGINQGVISGNLTARLCWLINQGIGNITLNDFYLLIVGLLNDPKQIPVLSCSKYISLTQTIMSDFDIGKTFLSNTQIPFPMGNPPIINNTVPNKNIILEKDYESETDYESSDDEISIIDDVTHLSNTIITDVDNQIKNELAKNHSEGKQLVTEHVVVEVESVVVEVVPDITVEHVVDEPKVADIETTVSEVEPVVDVVDEPEVADIKTTVSEVEPVVDVVDVPEVADIETTVADIETTVSEVETVVDVPEVADIETTVSEVETVVAEVESDVKILNRIYYIKEAEEKAAKEAKLKKEADEKAAKEAKLKKEAEEKAAKEAKLKKEADEKAAREAKLKKEADEKAAREAKLKKEVDEKAAREATLKKEADEKDAREAKLKKEADEKTIKNSILICLQPNKHVPSIITRQNVNKISLELELLKEKTNKEEIEKVNKAKNDLFLLQLKNKSMHKASIPNTKNDIKIDSNNIKEQQTEPINPNNISGIQYLNYLFMK